VTKSFWQWVSWIASCYAWVVNHRIKVSRAAVMSLALILTLGGALTACHKEEQAVVGAAKKAVSAEQQAQAKAQAKATTREEQRAALSRIPLPTKSQYVNVHEPSAWANPFLSVGAETIDLRIVLADANTSEVGQGTMLRPEAARRQELQLRPADLAEAVVALPEGAWSYGRVVAVAEIPGANAKDRPKIRRNVEAAIQQLNDLGIVVDEWPTR
jgi:hypothetical protein